MRHPQSREAKANGANAGKDSASFDTAGDVVGINAWSKQVNGGGRCNCKENKGSGIGANRVANHQLHEMRNDGKNQENGKENHRDIEAANHKIDIDKDFGIEQWW